MPEKVANAAAGTGTGVFRMNSWSARSLPILTASLFLTAIVFWSIDSCTIRNGVRVWRNGQDYLGLRFISPRYVTLTNETTHRNLTGNTSIDRNLTHTHLPNPSIDPNLTHTHLSNPSIDRNLTKSNEQNNRNLTHPPMINWIALEFEPNLTSKLLARWLAPGGEPCRDSRTVNISIPELDGHRPGTTLTAGEIHEFIFSAYDDAGNPRCSGGDYFETDLSGESWKSRPPIKDLGNGSYAVNFQVHPDFAGDYEFTVVLLFRSFEGLKFSPARFSFRRELRRIPIRFYRTATKLPELQVCQESDFGRYVWSGRWTRHGKNDTCSIDGDGRYRCQRPDFPCRNPWCKGSLGLLESNGWVYSAHCSFKIFSFDSAWECLHDRWIFFWGDSNHVDTIRNILNFILGLPEIESVPRRFDRNFTNPKNPLQSVRITSIFNGHWNETQNYQGLNSLRNDEFRELLQRYFSETTVPDTIIMNSGLHDGVYWRNIRAFAGGADYAARFWEQVLVSVRSLHRPKLFYRTTIATGGYARDLAFNPNKMEAFNGVVIDKLKERGLLSGVIDGFDLTFAWHYDNRCNDGVHYGRAPAKAKWRDGEIGHQYFVDLMLAHVLLNAICAGK